MLIMLADYNYYFYTVHFNYCCPLLVKCTNWVQSSTSTHIQPDNSIHTGTCKTNKDKLKISHFTFSCWMRHSELINFSLVNFKEIPLWDVKIFSKKHSSGWYHPSLSHGLGSEQPFSFCPLLFPLLLPHKGKYCISKS